MNLETFGLDCLVIATFALLAAGLIAVSYRVVDWALRKVNLEEQVQQGNLAAAVLSGAIVLGICVVVAAVITGVLH
jgi:uncharacterized membrane protein YjfL (UPF0719 family)